MWNLEKAMAPHSSTLAWKIPWTEEPGGPQSMGSLRVGHDWVTSLSLFTFMHWRRKWQPTPVLLPGKFHGWRSLVGHSPWGGKESGMTERLHFLSLSPLSESDSKHFLHLLRLLILIPCHRTPSTPPKSRLWIPLKSLEPSGANPVFQP